MPAHFDVLIENGRVFDGMGNPSREANVAIRDGRVVRISDEAIPHEAADEVLDGLDALAEENARVRDE